MTERDEATQALIDLVLSLQDKIESMEPWTEVTTKKSKVKGKESEVSETEEEDESTKGKRKEKARTPARRKGNPAKSRTYDTESSDGEATEGTIEDSKRKGRDSGSPPRRAKKTTKNDSETDENDQEGTSSKHRRRAKESAGRSKPSHRPSKTTKYYAVARGYKPGVYKIYKEAKRQVDGFTDATLKSFKSRTDAEKFVKT